MGDPCVDMLCSPERGDARLDIGRTGNDGATAMREDRPRYARLRAPFELRGHGGMSNSHTFAAFDAHDRPHDRGTVPDIEVDTLECVSGMPNTEHVWCVEDRRTSSRDSITHRGRNHGMLERVDLEANAADVG